MRPDWHQYFTEIALLTRSRSTCPRRQVGAVLVRDQRIIATGYNGSVKGQAHCDEVGCLMENDHCVRTVHAEHNAILQCASIGVPTVGAVLYTTDFPCFNCAKAIAQAGLKTVYYLNSYPDPKTRTILEQANLELVAMGETFAN